MRIDDNFFKQLFNEMSGETSAVQSSELKAATDSVYSLYESFINSGFNSGQALNLTMTTLTLVLNNSLKKG